MKATQQASFHCTCTSVYKVSLRRAQKVTAVIDSVHLRAGTPSRPAVIVKSIDIDILFNVRRPQFPPLFPLGAKNPFPKNINPEADQWRSFYSKSQYLTITSNVDIYVDLG